MRKINSSNKLVAIPIIIAIVTIIVFVNYYFVKPVKKMNEKIDVSPEEKFELENLTISYLNQNNDTSIDTFLLHEAANRKYEVAAEYYFIKNGRDHLDEYDKILELSRKIFDDKKVEITNFTVNVDPKRCGKEKYSTIEGFIKSDTCDLSGIVYEIVSTYKQNSKYVVEFYASKAVQERAESTDTCENFETPFSYKLTLSDLKNEQYYSKTEFKCCSDNCKLEGINSLKVNIISQIKNYKKLYKMTFEKNGDNFVFLKINNN